MPNSTDIRFIAIGVAKRLRSFPTQGAIAISERFMAKRSVKGASPEVQAYCRRLFATAIEHTRVTPGGEVQYFVNRYKDLGLSVVPSVGPSEYNFSVTHEHDGVPYTLYHNSAQVGEFNVDKVEHNFVHLQQLKARYHEFVKAVYDHLRAKVEGDLWVMSGGGTQLQAFFSNHTGYLGILYLGMCNPTVELDDYLKACGNETSTLVPNWERNEHLFKGINVPGIQVRL